MNKFSAAKCVLVIFAITILISGCGILYKPNMINAPSISDKKQFKSSANFNNIHMAYGVTDKISIMGNGYWSSNSINSLLRDTGQFYRTRTLRYNFEGAVGYFKKLESEPSISFDVYLGGGRGYLMREEIIAKSFQRLEIFNSAFNKVFFQPSVNFKDGNRDFIFSVRGVGMRFDNINASEPVLSSIFFNDDAMQILNTNYIFIEPAVTMRFGNEHIKFQIQGMYSAQINSEYLSYRKFGFSTAIHVAIGD